MHRKISLPVILAVVGLTTGGILNAAENGNSAEMKLREALKSYMLQLRDAQNQVATLQASQAESDEKVKSLTAQVESLTKQWTSDKDAADKALTTLKDKASKQDAEIARLRDTLAKWQAADKEAVDVARTKETERAKLAAENIVLHRIIDDREAKNAELFKIGNEILTRYEKFGLGTALLAKEPFVGLTRVKLENQVQDYQDKLLDSKVAPGTTPAPSAPPAASSPTPSPKPKKK